MKHTSHLDFIPWEDTTADEYPLAVGTVFGSPESMQSRVFWGLQILSPACMEGEQYKIAEDLGSGILLDGVLPHKLAAPEKSQEWPLGNLVMCQTKNGVSEKTSRKHM